MGPFSVLHAWQHRALHGKPFRGGRRRAEDGLSDDHFKRITPFSRDSTVPAKSRVTHLLQTAPKPNGKNEKNTEKRSGDEDPGGDGVFVRPRIGGDR
jgi:hypothetical protein